MIVSDAVESCVAMRGVRLPQPKSSIRALMVVVPSIEGSRKLTPWQEFELRRQTWSQTAPWLEVIGVPLAKRRGFCGPSEKELADNRGGRAGTRLRAEVIVTTEPLESNSRQASESALDLQR